MGNVSYSWTTTGGGTILNANSNNPQVDATGYYKLTITNPVNGCTNADSILVGQNKTVPNIWVNTTPDTIDCVTSSVLIQGNSTTSGVSYKWIGPGNISLATAKETTVDAAGVYKLTVTDVNNNCRAIASVEVKENFNIPSVPVLTNAENCTNTPTTTLSALGTKIKWYTDPTLGTANLIHQGNDYTPTSATTAGDYTYFVTQTDPQNGCESAAGQVTLKVHGLPVPPIPGNQEICAGEPVPAISAQGNAIKWYDAPGGTLLASGNSYTTGEMASGTYSYYATQTSAITGCESNPAAVKLSIHDNPPAPLVDNSSLKNCEGSANPAFTAQGNSIKWYTDNTLSVPVYQGNVFTPLNTNTGIYNYYVTQTNAYGCESTSTPVNFEVKAVPEQYLVSTGGSYCEGGAGIEVILPNSQTGVDYQLIRDSSVNAGSTVAGSDGSAISFGYQEEPGTYTVMAYSSNGCEAEMAGGAVVIRHPLPESPGIITGPVTACQGTTATFSVDTIQNATSYKWTLPAGATINNGGNTRTISVYFSNTAVSGAISVKGVNSCGEGPVGPVHSVTVNPLPDPILDLISGQSEVCQGETGVIYQIPAVKNATSYQWTVPAGTTIAGGQGTNQITLDFAIGETGGNIQVQAKNSCGTSAPSALINVTAKALPSVDAGLSDQVCANQYTLNGSAIPAGGSGNWEVVYGPATLANNTVNQTVTSGLRMGENKFSWSVTQNGCTSADTVTITNNKVTVNAGDDQFVCSRSTNLNAITPTTGGEWTVISGTGVIYNRNDNNSLVSGLSQAANKFAWTVNNNGCISGDTVTITNNRPLTPHAGADQQISSSSTGLDAGFPEAGTTGTWSIYSGGGTFVDVHDPKTEINNLTMGVNLLKWTVERNGCYLSDSVYIENVTAELTEAGSNQTLCTNVTNLNANEPIMGTGEWTVMQGAAQFEDNTAYNTKVYNLAPGVNILKWTVRNGSYSSSYDSVIIRNNQPTNANAGLDQNLCMNATALAGNVPTYGTGSWTLVNGSATIDDAAAFNSKVTNLAPGENRFRWTITNNTCTSSDEVIIYNGTPTQADAGQDQVICDDSTTLTPNTPTLGSGSWSVITGSGNITENTVTNLAPDINTLRWTITNGNCSSHDDVLVTSNKPTRPDAGITQSVCVDSMFLAANQPLTGTGEWSLQNGSAVIHDLNDPQSKVTNLSLGKNIFRWTISYKGCIEFDEVEIDNDLIEAHAGEDQTICQNNTILEANNADPGTGSWSILEQSSAQLLNPKNPGSQVTNLQQGANHLRWTIRHNACVTHDDVVITNDTPTESFAGADRSVCSTTTNLEANVALYGKGSWSLISGSGEISDSSQYNTEITNMQVGKNTFRWTIAKNKCVSSSEVTITNNLPVNVDAGMNQTVCSDSVALHANPPSIGTGHWSVLSGSARFKDPSAFASSAYEISQGINIFSWTVSSHDCSITDTIYVTSNMPTKAAAGADQILCADNAMLSANEPVFGKGSWSVISGSGTLADKALSVTDITKLGHGTNIMRWTIENKGCQSYDELKLVNNLPTQADAGRDAVVCGDSLRLFANTPAIGTGSWLLISGDGNILTPQENQTRITNLGFGKNTFRWITTYANCVTTDDVVLTNNKAEVNAGIDMEVYTSSTRLIGNAPLRGEGTWRVAGGSGILKNPNNFDTQVTGLSAGTNTFTWNIENNGCVATDEVKVTYYLMPVADFYPTAAEGCPPMEVTFVNKSIGGSPYHWDFGDGSTSDQTNVVHTFTEPGTYNVILTASAPGSKTVIRDTTIVVHEKPTADFEFAPEEVYVPGQHLRCYNYSSLMDSCEWNFGDGNTSFDFNPTYNYADTGYFNLTLVVSSKYGCRDSLTVYNAVHAKSRSKLQFPTAFTPNVYGPSDGHYNNSDRSNDVFYPIVVVGGLQSYHMQIFNRWGVMLFESNDISIGWDGYYRNKQLPEDVYIYKINGRYNDGEPFSIVGDVLLMRK